MISGKIKISKLSLQEQPYAFLVFFRIAIALFLFVHFAACYGDFSYLFGHNSILPNAVVDLYVPKTAISNYKLIQWLGLENEFFQQVFTIVFFVFILFLLIGFLTQFSALVLVVLHLSLINNNVFFLYGVDYFTSICLFFLCFLPSNIGFSVDAIVFGKMKQRIENQINFAGLRRLLGLFMCIAYFFSGFDKLLGYNWRNGEAIWKAITLPYSNLDFDLSVDWLSDYRWVLILMGWSVIILEMFYFLINIRPLRKYWLTGIILMHLGIALILNLYFFSVIMIILNITTYYDFSMSTVQESKWEKWILRKIKLDKKFMQQS